MSSRSARSVRGTTWPAPSCSAAGARDSCHLAARILSRLSPARPAAALDTATAARVAAPAGTLVLVAASTGDVLLLGVLAGVATLDLLTGGVAIGAGLATLLRWGSPSLTAVAGSQAVLGPGGLVGPVVAAASAWLAAAALVLVAP